VCIQRIEVNGTEVSSSTYNVHEIMVDCKGGEEYPESGHNLDKQYSIISLSPVNVIEKTTKLANQLEMNLFIEWSCQLWSSRCLDCQEHFWAPLFGKIFLFISITWFWASSSSLLSLQVSSVSVYFVRSVLVGIIFTYLLSHEHSECSKSNSISIL